MSQMFHTFASFSHAANRRQVNELAKDLAGT
jgi:hypothetical protein